MFDLLEIIGDRLGGPIVAVDVGAMDIDLMAQPAPRSPVAGSIAQAGAAQGARYQVIGFEPLEAECAKLNARGLPGHVTLPYAVGDGSERIFHETNFLPTSSLYEPNATLLAYFQHLDSVTRVQRKTPVRTHRLDDLPELSRIDFLKADVQGAELDVFRGAERLLAGTLVVEAEVEFLPLYKQQPLFADVDQFLRARGFVLHTLAELQGRAFRPMVLGGNPELPCRQTLWGDAIYVRDFTRWESLQPVELLRLATIVHDHYQSFDLVHLALRTFDRRKGSRLAEAYFKRAKEDLAAQGVLIDTR